MNTILKTMLTTILLSSSAVSFAQSGNHVFSGGEVSNFGIVDLATPSGKTWSTFRGAMPGYFSAVGAATYTNPSDANNVNGYVKHYATAANQAFNFPVGSGTDYRSLAIGGTIAANANIATAWISGNPSGNLDPTSTGAFGGNHDISAVSSGIGAVSTTGQWDWQDFNSSATGATVTVSIPDMSLFDPAADLRLVGWNGASWVNLSGAVGASGVTENSTLSGTMIAGISALGIGTTRLRANLTPRISVNPSNIIGTTTLEITVQINEIANYSTDGSVITLYVDKNADFSNFTFNTGQTMNINGQSVQNTIFAIDAVSNPDFYVITTNVLMQNSLRRVAFKVDFTPGVSSGKVSMNVFLENGSGGDVQASNNSNTTPVIYSF